MIAPSAVTIGWGLGLSALIGAVAWRAKALSPSGVLGAVITGTLLFGFGGWTGAASLVGFFVSSSVLSRLFRRRKAQAEAEYVKSGTRDLGQALANGGVAAAAALLFGITGDVRWMGALVAALAAANADTWATELGVLSSAPPRLITTFRQVAPGRSGAISAAGTVAALLGAAFIGSLAAMTHPGFWAFVPTIAGAGLAGALFDSLLGATVQAVYRCPACDTETERHVHRCGEPTYFLRGWAWLGNDLVNLLATALGAGVGWLLVR